MRLMILFIWRVWFYTSFIPVIFYSLLAIAAFHPKGYNFIFWCARYIGHRLYYFYLVFKTYYEESYLWGIIYTGSKSY